MDISDDQVGACRLILVLFVIMLVSGCTSVTTREYAPFVRDLDGTNELVVSTYPAGFPDQVSRDGTTFEEYETYGALYFQVFVRDKRRSIGSSPELASMRIHSFSYRLDDEPPTELLSGYTGSFWMQGNRRSRMQEPSSSSAKRRLNCRRADRCKEYGGLRTDQSKRLKEGAEQEHLKEHGAHWKAACGHRLDSFSGAAREEECRGDQRFMSFALTPTRRLDRHRPHFRLRHSA